MPKNTNLRTEQKKKKNYLLSYTSQIPCRESVKKVKDTQINDFSITNTGTMQFNFHASQQKLSIDFRKIFPRSVTSCLGVA